MRANVKPTSSLRVHPRRAALLASTVLGLSFAVSASAETREFCDRTTESCAMAVRGAHLDASSVERTNHPGPNTEAAARTMQDSTIPFRISVDGEPIAVAGVPHSGLAGQQDAEDRQRVEDLRLEAVDIQVKYDGLNVQPTLNVSNKPIERLLAPGQTVEFFGNWNYPDWILHSEVRILDEENDVLDTVAMSREGSALWTVPDDPEMGAFGKPLSYTLRVYDAEGRYDETVPLPIKITKADRGVYTDWDGRGDGDAESAFVSEVPGYAEDRTAVRNIPIHGGVVTVYGRHIPADHKVIAFGRELPIGVDRNFVAQQIVRPGTETVDVAVLDAGGEGLRFSRDIVVPEDEWFLVGIADLAVGRTFRHGDRIEAVDAEDKNRFHTRGRAALYLKGKIKGKYLLTGALDTGDDEIEELFKNLDEKDPRQLLRRLDPDDYYPVYGDDSTIVEDAPTRGKFYVRLERGDSHVMWGNFKTRITGSEFARQERGLYGANVLYRSEETTNFGERVASIQGYVADPGTLPQRDEFRGTGGSAYFLKRQDITVGSETVTMEIRDRVTDLPKSRRVLRPQEDYTVDYVQGVILLRRPLSSTAAAGEVIRDGQLGGDDVFLTAQYEFSPTLSDVDSFSYGARAQGWLANVVRVGTSAYRDEDGGDDQTLLEADARVRLSEDSYLDLEAAASEGQGTGFTSSVDGGFRFDNRAGVGRDGQRAYAYRAKGTLDLADAGIETVDGKVGVHYEKRKEGFSAIGRTTTEDTEIAGAFAEVDPTGWTTVSVRFDSIERERTGDEWEGTAQVEARLSDAWKTTVAVSHSDRNFRSGSDRIGNRTDVGAKVVYEQPGYSVYGFGQVTARKTGDRQNNHRAGVGVEVDVTDRLSASAEVSGGSLGWGGLAALSYEPTVDQRYYFGYRLDADRTDGDLDGYDPLGRDTGSFVFGTTQKINNELSVYGEENFDLIGHRQSVTHAYGVTYTPDDRWKLHGSAESGEFRDDRGDDFDRHALSAGVDYAHQGLRAGLRGEVRIEDSDVGTRQDRQTFLASANSSININKNWRSLVHIDAVVSESDQSAVLDGDYVEGSLGFAYRPVENDRFNGLARYTFLYDLPGPEQENSAGQTLGPKQRSHIVSLDGMYDINEVVSVGGKYGFRYGEISDSRIGNDWTTSTAHLGIVRADVHVVKNWDAVVEARILHLPEAESTRLGAFAAVYRHFGDNLKLGVGYNFGEFSDDLTDLTYDDQGVFVNVVGKF